jgi:phosphate transport system protein
MSKNDPHTLKSFDDALSVLRKEVLMMFSLTRQNLDRALKGLFDRDLELCKATIADDEEIDQLEKEIDALGVGILMRFQPLAVDLRRVVAAIKINGALERIADKAASIARKARKLEPAQVIPEIDWLRPLAEKSTDILRAGETAFETGDVELARTIKAKDRDNDAEYLRLSDRIVTAMAKGGDTTAGLLNLVFIGRHLERVGDYSTNIAEDVIFAEAAEDIRHSQK